MDSLGLDSFDLGAATVDIFVVWDEQYYVELGGVAIAVDELL